MRSARNANKATAIGTTQRGIGPAYEDKVGACHRLMDLADLATRPHKVDRLLASACTWSTSNSAPAAYR